MSRSRSPRKGQGNGHGETGDIVIVITGLTKNVHKGHLQEIFGVYGKIVALDLPKFEVCQCNPTVSWTYAEDVAGLNKGKAAIQYDRPSEAEKAAKHMDGGVLDGSTVKVQVRAPSK